ncbi:centromere protein J [Neocloeon triangulifer]|uniref:centromere protein J n=1 Tax=Neocloeon triangulifer TaxID=2078957 RepID=UPI00286F4F14|nr:centromere protein J [Neocloeon triangulifer]
MAKQSSLNVLGKLVDLKQWQSQQHEKLVKEQEKHREILVEEQSNRFQQQLQLLDQSRDSVSHDGDLSSEEETTPINHTNGNISVENDDRSFATFPNIQREEETADSKPTKKTFLKRGEGLSRFRMSHDDMENQRKRILASKGKKKPGTGDASSKEQKRKLPEKVTNPRKREVKSNKIDSRAKPAQRQILVPRAPIPPTLKLVPPKKNLFREPKVHEKKAGEAAKSVTVALKEDKSKIKELPSKTWSTVLATAPAQISSSSPMRKFIEQRELRVFERMEKLADDSSFCSTSSTYARFIEGGYISSVQNTPQSSPVKRQSQSPLALDPPVLAPNPTVENAKALLQQLAALRFGLAEDNREFLENNINLNELKLDLSGLQSATSSEDEDSHHEIDLTDEEWSKTSNSSDSETSSSYSAYAKIIESNKNGNHEDLENTLVEGKDNESVASSEDGIEVEKIDDDYKLSSAMHVRLEQLQREVLVVQEQQANLHQQRAELAGEKEKLAKALEEAEEQKRKFRGTKLQQQFENRKVDELKKQLEELQTLWKDKEVRWASAQASQRAQLWQLSQENKNLAQQIKELKLNQAKKVHFAPVKSKTSASVRSVLKKPAEPEKPPSLEPRYDKSAEEPEEENSRINCARDLDDALKLYQRLCPKEDSPNSSLMTPRSINKAYFDIFNPKRNVSPEALKSKEIVEVRKEKLEPAKPEKKTLDAQRKPVFSESIVPEVLSYEEMRPRSVLPERVDQPSRVINPTTTEATSDIVKSQTHPDGTKQIWYSCGNTLKVSADGAHRRMVFHNGDVQESWNREGITRYFYSDSRVWHETYSNGTQTISYPDGQKEVLKNDGSKEVTFPDGSSMCIDSDGKQTANLCDGSKLFLNSDGSSILEMPNGLREIRTTDSTTLQYPDGTIRVQYPSGLLETKYPNGRVRVKNAEGKLIIDTHCPVDSK